MIWLSEQQQRAIKILAAQNPQEESCGLVMDDGEVILLPNEAPPGQRHERFSINPMDFARLEPHGIRGVWHSHTEQEGFSPLDQEVMMADIMPWAVYCLRTDKLSQADPQGIAPYVGRPFVYGLYDCYSLISDYLSREKAVRLPPWKRGKWGEWDTDSFACFDEQWYFHGRKVSKDAPLAAGDILLFNLGKHRNHTDHVGIYIGDGKFLHHLSDRESSEEAWGGHWRQRLRWAIRPLKLWTT